MVTSSSRTGFQPVSASDRQEACPTGSRILCRPLGRAAASVAATSRSEDNPFRCGLLSSFSPASAASPGRAKWDFVAGDHIEGGPAAADGVVFFPAGNDGLYALDADTGKKKWNFRADLHIDSSPAVVGGRVFVGSGRSRRFATFQV